MSWTLELVFERYSWTGTIKGSIREWGTWQRLIIPERSTSLYLYFALCISCAVVLLSTVAQSWRKFPASTAQNFSRWVTNSGSSVILNLMRGITAVRNTAFCSYFSKNTLNFVSSCLFRSFLWNQPQICRPLPILIDLFLFLRQNIRPVSNTG